MSTTKDPRPFDAEKVLQQLREFRIRLEALENEVVCSCDRCQADWQARLAVMEEEWDKADSLEAEVGR